MISKLTIENFILIEKAEIDFSDGLNIISGETGSGKSILILALKMLFGERINSEQIRDKERKTILEGVFSFESAKINAILIENDIDLQNSNLIIRKEFTMKGVNRVFINDTPSNNNVLKQIGEHLIDFHGQHDNQIILKRENQLQLVDSYLDLTDKLKTYKSYYSQYQKTIQSFNIFIAKKNQSILELEVESIEIEELRKLNIKPNEIEELTNELDLIENAEILNYEVNATNSLLYQSDNSAYITITQALKHLSNLTKFDDSLSNFISELESAKIAIKETFNHLNDLKDSFDYNENKIEALKQRLRTLKSIEKKYGSQELIFERLEYLEDKQYKAENFETIEKNFKDELYELSNTLIRISAELNKARKESAPKIEKEISNKLMDLGINNPLIKLEFEKLPLNQNNIVLEASSEKYVLNSNGMDSIEFLISTNKGIAPASLIEIASGGEVSRVMLALKSIFANKDEIETYIFDEIDTGISGEIAKKVGISMKELSKQRQFLVITHLPQIAALSDNHINVSKHENENGTISTARILNLDEKLNSIATMISGNQISKSALNIAKELIQ